MSKDNIEKLTKLFYDPKKGLNSIDKLKIKAEENKIDLKPKDIETFYNSQTINHIMKPARKPHSYSSYVANYPGHIYQMDIIVYQKYKYHNYQYILVMIDIYSRYAIARAMTNRNLTTIINNFESMIEEIGIPFKIQCDNEFNKPEFRKVMKEYDIEVMFSDPNQINKNPIVERVNATLEILLQKMRILLNNPNWKSYLDDAVYNYNTTFHSTVKAKPKDIFEGKEINMQDVIKVKYSYNPGDKVKIIKKSSPFDKVDVVKLSEKTYIVESTKGEKIKLYNEDKLYKPYELKKVFVSDNEEQNNNLDIVKPTKEYKEYRQKIKNDKIGINEANIITEKRTVKKNKKYN